MSEERRLGGGEGNCLFLYSFYFHSYGVCMTIIILSVCACLRACANVRVVAAYANILVMCVCMCAHVCSLFILCMQSVFKYVRACNAKYSLCMCVRNK